MPNFPCIKCKTPYEESDAEAYYCPACLEEKKAIAAEIDSKIRPSKAPPSGLAAYDAMPKVNGRFPSASNFL